MINIPALILLSKGLSDKDFGVSSKRKESESKPTPIPELQTSFHDYSKDNRERKTLIKEESYSEFEVYNKNKSCTEYETLEFENDSLTYEEV